MQWIPQTRQPARIATPFRIASALLACAVAIMSYRYVVGIGVQPPAIVANAYAHPGLAIHAAGAATALLVGSLQFSRRLRSRWPRLHRRLGRVYLLGCLVGGVAGLVLAWGSTAGPIATAGFGLLATVWIAVNLQGWRCAVRQRYVAHRTWMIRSWALTLAAVTLRVDLVVILVLGLPFVASYRAASFLCWVPNLAIAETYLWWSRIKR